VRADKGDDDVATLEGFSDGVSKINAVVDSVNVHEDVEMISLLGQRVEEPAGVAAAV
jgi:hypothetical protein